MKALALPGRRESLATDLQLRLLDLECCQDTAVGGGWFRGVSGGQVKRTSAGARPPKDAPRTHPPPASLRLSWHAGRPCAHARAKMRVRTAPAWASVSEPGTLCATQPRALDGWAPSLAARCQSAHVSAKAARRLQRPACLPLPCRGAAACARPGRASRQHEPPPRARARAPRHAGPPRRAREQAAARAPCSAGPPRRARKRPAGAQARRWSARSACTSWTRSPPAWTRRPRTRSCPCWPTWRTWRACARPRLALLDPTCPCSAWQPFERVWRHAEGMRAVAPLDMV